MALALLLAAPPCLADRVVPSERVRSSVVVREGPERSARPVGRLAKGEEMRWLESVPGWHQVELADGASGFVSAAWTQLLVDPPPPAPEVVELPPEPRPGFFERITYTVSRAFGGGAPVAIDIQEPLTTRTALRHPEPTLPVSGFAAAGGLVELVLAIDASTSANEFSESDVDGDGELEDIWAGDDSIYQAQILAARHLVAGLNLLPGNGEGERIRVAVVSFSGDDSYRLYEPDRDFDPTVLSILALANRDARLHIGLSSDYQAVDVALTELASEEASGMTNMAAALGRAVVELEGLAAMGATESRPRDGALRIVDFLTDGMPSLPYDREEAERAARYAAYMAEEAGIRVNVFELGKNAVTRKNSKTGERLARESGGTFVKVDRAGDIVRVLPETSLAFVDRVRLANLTTGDETSYITTGVDGSFYGEVPLAEGENTIAVVAVLQDGRERELEIEVDYTKGLPTPELQKRLTLVREENAALIDQIKTRLARDIENQRKQLDVGAGPEATPAE